jgi:hypothetical protein
MVAGIDEENSPRATTDGNGVFVFTEVPPETYGLAVSTPIGVYLIKTEEGRDFLFTVKAGEVLDLGEVHTSLPY